MKRFIIIIPILFFSSCGVIKGCKNPTVDKTIKTINKAYPDDNVVEEMVEEKIEDITGLDIDLSPASPEEKEEEK